jgi:choloylglycine hydrolase
MPEASMNRSRLPLVALLGLVGVALFAAPGLPCARVLWSDTGRAVVVGRSMNWPAELQADLWAFPRGLERIGLNGKSPLKWTSKHGSVAVGFRDVATADGVNEKGLAASVLWLDEADYGPRDEAVPGLATTLWGQFYLEQFATVAEAVVFTEKTPFQLVPVKDGVDVSRLHLALADATGDSAIIEYVGGKAKVYHGRRYSVMTNSPPLPEQLKNLDRYRGPGALEGPPKDATSSADRFVVASRLLADLPKPGTDRQAVADLFGVLRAVSVPRLTRWRAVADLTNRVYYFESAASPAVVWVPLDRLKLDAGNPVLKLDLANDADRAGESSGAFKKADPFKFAIPGH